MRQVGRVHAVADERIGQAHETAVDGETPAEITIFSRAKGGAEPADAMQGRGARHQCRAGEKDLLRREGQRIEAKALKRVVTRWRQVAAVAVHHGQRAATGDDIGVGGEERCLLGDALRDGDIIVIEAGNQRRAAERESGIQGGDLALVRGLDEPHAGIGARETAQDVERLDAAAVIDNDTLEVAPGLIENGPHRRFDMGCAIVGRHEDRYGRDIGARHERAVKPAAECPGGGPMPCR